MGLIEEFAKQPNAQEPEPKVKVYVDGDHASAEFPPEIDIPAGEKELLEVVGLDPEEWELVGNQGLTDHRDESGNRIQVWYKPKFRRRGLGIDWSRVIDELEEYEPKTDDDPPREGDWFHAQFGDIHIGKSALAGGGAEQIAQKYMDSLSLAEWNLVESCWPPEGIVLSFVGDLVEGYVSNNGKNIAQTDLELGKQMTAAGRMIHKAVKTFAPYGVPVKVVIIGGNHDETTRVQATSPGDNYAAMIASFLAMKYEDSEMYEHVEVMIPPEGQGHMTIDVGGTLVTYVHGHKFGGGNIEKKVQDWWSGQALHGRVAGGSHLLCCGHFHSFRHLQISRDKTAIMSPALEIESSWLAEMNGSRSKRGCVTYTTKEGDVQNVCVV